MNAEKRLNRGKISTRKFGIYSFSFYLKHNLFPLLSATVSITASQMVEEIMQKELLSAMRIHG